MTEQTLKASTQMQLAQLAPEVRRAFRAAPITLNATGKIDPMTIDAVDAWLTRAGINGTQERIAAKYSLQVHGLLLTPRYAASR